jgi:hypothetical protein
MNWDAISAVAELSGAAAVVISLVYLAVQIRQSARISAAEAFKGIIDGNNEHFRFMFSPENAPILARGLEDYDGLSPTERMGFESLMAGVLNQVEASFITLQAQMMSEETMKSWAWWLRTRLFCYEGARLWWSEAKPGFDPDVAAWIDEQVAAADPGQDVFGIRDPE